MQVMFRGLGVARVTVPSDHLAGFHTVAFPEIGTDPDTAAVVGPGRVVVEMDVERGPSVVVADVDSIPGDPGVSSDPGDGSVGRRHHGLQMGSRDVVSEVQASPTVPGGAEG